MPTDTHSKSDAIRDFLSQNPNATSAEVVTALREKGIEVTPGHVATVKNRAAKSEPKKSKSKTTDKPPKTKTKSKRSEKTSTEPESTGPQEKTPRPYHERPYPQKTLEDALRVPQSIKDLNGGNPWATKDLADALGYTNLRTPTFIQLMRAAKDYGLINGTNRSTEIELAQLGRDIVYPDSEAQERQLKINSFFNIDVFKKVYDHYGSSNSFPEQRYLSSTLEKSFGLSPELHNEFIELIKQNCKYLGIEDGLKNAGYKQDHKSTKRSEVRSIGKEEGNFDRTAFVIMPFSEKGQVDRPHGFFNELLVRLITPAANNAGFAVKTADQKGSDIIQSTIINQLLQADLVIADITDHNPNVLFELGIRIAKEKPVALIRAEGTGRVFDVDNLMRVTDYNANLWTSTVAHDLPKLTEHIKGAWDHRDTYATYMEILTQHVSLIEKPA
ncbi:hypothetical protein [Blastopirellula marina]|uniref:Uncharacterized protein n=1 Tax=Blastopirellula marina DSM 3645 TaxID=314230 RepID=A4A0L5_9BACT|nr:hypothetical protein [Blastopirellula marina]EAQ77681.1 hypothetical protein DSM3645_01901 [Blastopirellula marina DSM 3645]